MESPSIASMELSRREIDTETTIDLEVEFEDEQTVDSPQPTRPESTSRLANVLSKLVQSDSESDNDAAPVRVPRGTLAARLQQQQSQDEGSSESDEEDAGAAYERVKKMLSKAKEQKRTKVKGDAHIASHSSSSDEEEAPRRPTKNQPLPRLNHQHSVDGGAQPAHVSVGASSDDEDDDDDDDDDFPVRNTKTRRLISRKQKTASPHSPSSTPKSRPSSPGLFVSPNASPVVSKPRKALHSTKSDSEESTSPRPNKDLQERVKKIRAERMRQQKEQQEQKKQSKPRHREGQDSDSDPDGETGRRLTQQSKPTRKASKKAMEEIAREQQRINRNMQLTHQAKTKKKYGMKDLFARFNYNQPIPEETTAPLTPDASSMIGTSDAEGNQAHDTPPTSPLAQDHLNEKPEAMATIETPPATEVPQEKGDIEAPVATTPPPMRMDKGKGRAPEFQHLPINPLIQQAAQVITQKAQIPVTTPREVEMVDLSDSDDETKTVKPKSRFPVFDRLPERQQKDSSSLLHLRHLAHLSSPGKKGPKMRGSMNAVELSLSLTRRAREQAQKERQEKIEDLKRRGIHIETEEEREKHQMEVEDMVAQLEKARQEDLKLRKMEKEEAKKNGETGASTLSSDESGDEDYVGSGEEDAGVEELEEEPEEEVELELSGSEEEDIEGEVDEEEQAEATNPMFDQEADEADDEEKEQPTEKGLDVDEDMEDGTFAVPARKLTARRGRNVVVDDEDDSENEGLKSMASSQQPSQATQDDPMAAAFGFNNVASSLGLTQVFAGTMANLESDSQNDHPLDHEQEQNSLDFLRSLPDTQPAGLFNSTPDLLVPNSQALDSQMEVSQSQMNLGITQLMEPSPSFPQTQLSEMPEPTQDVGFGLSRSPAGLVAPPSTIDTVMMPVAESPTVQRRGRLQSRKEKLAELSDVDEDDVTGSETEETEAAAKSQDAFAIMKRGQKKQRAVDDFNKKTSRAKDVVEEQAEESEDEYAGIGGASDDDSGEDDEELAKMIETGHVDEDEREIAAYYAAKEKADDEKNVNKIFKDLASGALRKRRGGEAFDVSDSEDEEERRRRTKQRQFQQMHRAFLSDERIKTIAENPKKSAFLRSVEDREDDPDYQFLDAPMAMDVDTSQESTTSGDIIAIPDSQTAEPTTTAAALPAANPLKRKSTDSQDKENRPPPHARRTAAVDTSIIRKPMTHADIQHSLIELLEDDRHIVPESQYSDLSSDSELEITNLPPRQEKKPIIDRLSLSRSASLSSTPNSAAGASNLAFVAAASGVLQPGFRVPSLVRRATSNLSATSERSGVSTPVEGVRRGGTGRSNIHAQAREAERREKLEKVELKRKEELKRKVGRERNGKRSVLGGLDGGFE
ncbi:MRC1-like domain-domain-containing protein [Clohesyomyces aquaticus]|uniref:MRC1-like domain-domain-containing protein n=1 Tax=Clohesyomyces aquaticus TaxID=1231657 RepID=A0A1Y1YGK7_9PLEO|nr:MRC1-like domain-domain-containing protein [Clohesyomyces aquaticus]